MPAQTQQDFANLVDGSDFTTAVYTGANIELSGILSRGPGGALDVNDNRLRLMLVREDADKVAIGSTITVAGNFYTVREKEPGDRAVTLVLEAD